MPAFLSDEWLDAVEALQSEAPEPPDALKDLVINLIIQGRPEGDAELRMEAGQFARGHAEGAPTTLTVPHDVAQKLFVDQDQQAAMQAFMSGQIKVQGDMTKIMAMQAGGPPTPEQEAFAKKIADLTD